MWWGRGREEERCREGGEGGVGKEEEERREGGVQGTAWNQETTTSNFEVSLIPR